MIEDGGDAHQIDVHPEATTFIYVIVAPQPLAPEHPEQAGFLFGLPRRRIARPLPLVDRPLRNDPSLAAGRGDQGDFDAIIADAIWNYRRLAGWWRHEPDFPRGAARCCFPSLLI